MGGKIRGRWSRFFTGFKGKQNVFVISGLTPLMLYLMFWVLFPIVWVVVLGFFKYKAGASGGWLLGLGGENAFIGLDNYRNMFIGDSLEGRTFRVSLVNTLIFSFLVLPLNLVITLPLAAAIEALSHWFFKTFFRFVYFLPALVASVGVALMWTYLYHPQRGLINMLFKMIGLSPQLWLSNPKAAFLGVPLAMWAIIIAYLWRDMGYNLIIFIAALQGIPQDFKEAAVVDGANSWQVFWRITLPLLQPTLMFVCVLTMISSFQIFDIIQIMTQTGNPQNQTRVLMLDLYLNAFRYQRMGFASAEALVLFIFILIVTLIQLRLLRTRWEY